MPEPPNRVPTIDDLRVKLCYICREEEGPEQDQPAGPPKQWIHPCRCTLVAHETCLLQWIQSAERDASRAPNALKCPQCSSQYQMQSKNPFVLRLMKKLNGTGLWMGRWFLLGSAAGIIVVVGSGFFVMMTAYGAWAVRQFIGNEMFDLLLTDDPANWSWPVLLNLPAIPLSLILSRFSNTHNFMPLFPILLIWPSAVPPGVISQGRWSNSINIFPKNTTTTTQSNSLLSISNYAWPPTPFVFGMFVVPFVRSMYRRWFKKFEAAILGSDAERQRQEGGDNGAQAEGDVLEIHIRANIEVGDGGQGHQNGGQGQDQGQEGEQQAPRPQQHQRPNAAAGGGNNNANNNNDQGGGRRNINLTSLGRTIGGALLIPAISNIMGNLLYRLSARVPFLKTFLGVRPPLASIYNMKKKKGVWTGLPPWFGAPTISSDFEKMGFAGQLGSTLKAVMITLWGGTRTWAEADPVWWRNSVGFGLFILARDCADLWYRWLAKRELNSRHLKSHDFQGIEIQELDLKPSFFS
ncbi:hypothetical protein BDN72DRAFT_894884 [Pluteus cervinus]|uniref:Uncharacterized protein n=1 Tax=Pluteus cervinus TaxID=181527 RepID=A0ACD3B277_9AGAR|nr:hypothetical protein BDN72DRAFT_894884 [Pluteus cervinus]